MAHLPSKRFQHSPLFYIVLACFASALASGIVFGWAGMVLILIREGEFEELCDGQFDEDGTCRAQSAVLAGVYPWGAVSTMLGFSIWGQLIDRKGPRITCFAGCLSIITGLLIFSASSSKTFNAFTVGYFFMGMGGPGVQLSILSFANLLPKVRNTILQCFSGLFVVSSFIFSIFQFLNQHFDISRRTLVLSYVVAPLCILVCALSYWPKTGIRLPPPPAAAAAPLSSPLPLSGFVEKHDDNKETSNDKQIPSQTGSVPDTVPDTVPDAVSDAVDVVRVVDNENSTLESPPAKPAPLNKMYSVKFDELPAASVSSFDILKSKVVSFFTQTPKYGTLPQESPHAGNSHTNNRTNNHTHNSSNSSNSTMSIKVVSGSARWFEATNKPRPGTAVFEHLPFSEAIRVPLFWYFALWSALQTLRVNYWVGAISGQLAELGDSPAATNMIYTRIVSMIIPFGIITITPYGLLMDRFGLQMGFQVLHFEHVLLGVLSLVPSLSIQVLNAVVYMVLRPAHFGFQYAFVARVFGFTNFGKFFGIICVCTGLIGMLQFVLVWISYNVFDGSSTVTNTICLALTVPGFFFRHVLRANQIA
eukprot:GILJ01004370.1.p1 GENE.GILJ01004370.1~~GILJ01004370.1.p1  ORF type:complete len:589 (-),score=64.54 GILJ01004370.1:1483-3249(-)